MEFVKGIDAVTPVANVHTADIAGATRPAVAAVRVRARVARSHHAVVAEYILTRGTVCKDTFVKRYIDAGIAKLSLAAGAIAAGVAAAAYGFVAPFARVRAAVQHVAFAERAHLTGRRWTCSRRSPFHRVFSSKLEGLMRGHLSRFRMGLADDTAARSD